MAEVAGLLPTYNKLHRPTWLRLVNWTGDTLRRGGIDLVKLNSESLLAEAQRQTKLSDWGDESFQLP